MPWKYLCRNHQALICKWCAGSRVHKDHIQVSVEQAAQEFKVGGWESSVSKMLL
ncbi:TRIM27: Zinc finger protein RFP [Crotalus adamanteus]|uniref:TRIM27: Zinc finger protein RFP n=1 Tax=Crotalus adamanteus TaxID=8729 RepID=A0AAW1BVF4_CROAD